MSSNLNLKIVSFNVSGIADMIRAADKLQKSENAHVSEQAMEILQTKDLTEIFGQVSAKKMNQLIDRTKADILCLQEMPKVQHLEKYEYAEIAGILNKHDYNLQLFFDTAIAYKKDKFNFLKGDAFGEESQPAYYADLQFKNHDITVRVVSDHPSYSPEIGDNAFKKNLELIDIQKKVNKLFFWKKNPTLPDVILYGLDANAPRSSTQTSKGEEGVDLDFFTQMGYQTDLKDDNPTTCIRNKNLKIDHIFAKALKGTIVMEHQIIPELNGEKLLSEKTEEFPASDHLPVIYDLKIIL